MTFQQAIDLGAAAKAAGYIVAIKDGKAQFQTILFKPNGVSEVMEHTDWLEYEEAMDIIRG